MDLKCSIIHKHFFFFFCICTCSHSQIFCRSKFAEEGVKRDKNLCFAFLETVPSATAPKELEEMAGAVSLKIPFSLFVLPAKVLEEVGCWGGVRKACCDHD